MDSSFIVDGPNSLDRKPVFAPGTVPVKLEIMGKLAATIFAVLLLGLAYRYLFPTGGDGTREIAAVNSGQSVWPGERQPADPGPSILQAAEDPDPRQRFLTLLQNGDYDSAARLYESLEHGDPVLFDTLQAAYHDHLRQMIKDEEYATVVSLTDVFRNYYYNDFHTLVYLAAACSHLGDFRCTIDAYYGAALYGVEPWQVKTARSTLKLFLDKTDTLWSKGQRWSELITLYEHALQWEPDNSIYHLRLAELYLELGYFDSALASLASVAPGAELALRIDRVKQAVADQSQIATGIPLQKKGNHYLVDVLLNGVPVRLMIDTGASISALSGDAAATIVDRAGLQYQGETRLSTAGGTIDSRVYLADTVAIDRHQLYGIEWVVIDYPDTDIDGVLGMNILSQFEFRLDQKRQLLILQQR